MEKILTLNFDSRNKLVAYIPSVEKKINYYYKVTSELHKFDEGFIQFQGQIKNEKKTKTLMRDVIQEIVVRLYGKLNKALKNQLQLPSTIEIGSVGKESNIDSYYNLNHFDDQKYWLFSTNRSIQTWLYNDSDGNIILEISPSYPWMYRDPSKKETFIPFEDFIKNYQVYALFTIDKQEAIKCKTICDQLIKQLNIYI